MNPSPATLKTSIIPAPNRQRILNVHDNPVSRHTLTRMLIRQGFAVTEADTAAAALLEVRRELPHLILMKHQLPGEDSDAVSDEVRRIPGAAHLPVLLLSDPGPNDACLLTEAHNGADACLTWPVSEEGLAATIHSLLRIRQVENRLRETEARFRATFEQAAVGLGHLNFEGRWTWVNQRLARIFGYPRQELLQLACADLMELEGRSSFVAQQRRILLGEAESFAVEPRCRRKDGSELWASFVVSVARDLEGKPLHLVAVVDDISVRKWTEANLSRIRAAVESSSEAVALFEVEGGVTYVNRAFTRLFGRRLEDLQGAWATRLLFADPAVGRSVYDAVIQRHGWRGEVEMRGAGGQRLQVELRLEAIRDEQDAVVGFIGLHTDVSQRRELEVQFQRAQRLEALGRLAAGVAHDFNNLLTVIRGNAELLLMSSERLPKEGVDCLNNIVKASDSAAHLTRQLLIFSRRQTLQPQPVNLNELVRGLAKMLRRVIREDIRMECVPAEGLPCVFADPGMLEQVLMNLVVNARDAMPQGGDLRLATETVELEAASASTHPEARAGQFVCLRVSDTGVGIPADQLPHIFDPFFTTKQPGQGTGLGLATVDSIARQHHGWVEVSSRVGEGSEFRVYLPAITPASVESDAGVRAMALPRGTEGILLVEDEASVRTITRQVLVSLGYQVREAEGGREAMAVWEGRKNDIALLLSDMVLPDGISGRDLAKRFRSDKPELKVLLTSGHGPEIVSADTAFFRDQKICFLRKPASALDLARAVRQCLDESKTAAG